MDNGPQLWGTKIYRPGLEGALSVWTVLIPNGFKKEHLFCHFGHRLRKLALIGRSARLGSAWPGSDRLGSAWLRPGSARLGSCRVGSARLGSAWLGFFNFLDLHRCTTSLNRIPSNRLIKQCLGKHASKQTYNNVLCLVWK